MLPEAGVFGGSLATTFAMSKSANDILFFSSFLSEFFTDEEDYLDSGGNLAVDLDIGNYIF